MTSAYTKFNTPNTNECSNDDIYRFLYVCSQVIARTKQAKEGKDAETLKFFFDMIEKHFVPLFSDENWWVRKVDIHKSKL